MEESSRFFSNMQCEYFPCHSLKGDFNCLFCYCPMYSFKNCLGNPRFKKKNEKLIKICTDCIYPHIPGNYDSIIGFLSKNKVKYD